MKKFKNESFNIELNVEVKTNPKEEQFGNNLETRVVIEKIEDGGRINVKDDGDRIIINVRGEAESYTLSHALRYIADQLDPNKNSEDNYYDDISDNYYFVRKIKTN